MPISPAEGFKPDFSAHRRWRQATGKPGGMLMFHGNLVHGSAGNITPYPRKIVYLTLSAVSNAIVKPTRPEWIAHTDFTPIEPVADDALLQYGRARKAEAPLAAVPAE